MIQVKDVTKKYGNFIAVKNLNFEIKHGEVIGLLGPNGAGKSTTMNMLTGFIEPSEGSIIINGKDIVKKAREAKKNIGYMPENVPLYLDLTVREFVTYMAELKLVQRKERKKQVEEIIKATGLEDVKNKLIRNLSRGYKQRVSMAGALVGKPEILILDEPTVGLDPKQIIEIRELIKSLGKDHTVIISSHILSEISQICEKVIIINKGEIVAIDTPENLEKLVNENNSIIVTVEDKENKMPELSEKVEEISKVELVKDNEDGTKQYVVFPKDDIDLRKTLFDVLPKENITIFELRKSEATLEEAFIKLINKNEKGGKENVDNNQKRSKELLFISDSIYIYRSVLVYE